MPVPIFSIILIFCKAWIDSAFQGKQDSPVDLNPIELDRAESVRAAAIIIARSLSFKQRIRLNILAENLANPNRLQERISEMRDVYFLQLLLYENVRNVLGSQYYSSGKNEVQ